MRLDHRWEFGSAHLVDLFQHISSFIMAVARVRIDAYDAAPPYGRARRAWQRYREKVTGDDRCSFADIYLNDGFGFTCTDGLPLRGVAAGRDRVAAELGMERGSVRLHLHVEHSWPEIHLAIVRRTFQEAGWEIATDKVQLGLGLVKLSD